MAASLLTWLVFATGFVVRPVGAALFGHLGDKIGRKTTFITTLLLMGVSHGPPPHLRRDRSRGHALLTAFRILQGVSLGGEYGGTVTCELEHAASRARAFYVGFVAVTSPFGLALVSLTLVTAVALLVTLLLLPETKDKALDWFLNHVSQR